MRHFIYIVFMLFITGCSVPFLDTYTQTPEDKARRVPAFKTISERNAWVIEENKKIQKYNHDLNITYYKNKAIIKRLKQQLRKRK